MTLNIGSNKISRLAIGQADGTVKQISQLNLGNNVIFRSGPDPAYNDDNMPEGTARNFILRITDLDLDQLIIKNPIRGNGQILIYNSYPGNLSQSITVAEGATTDLTQYLPNLTKSNIIEFKVLGDVGTPFYMYNTSNIVYADPFIQGTKNGSIMGCARLLHAIPLTSLARWNGSKYLILRNTYQYFNRSGSIYFIKNGNFETPSGYGVDGGTGLQIYGEFNAGGKLTTLPRTGFSSSAANTFDDTRLWAPNFNGTSQGNAGDLINANENPEYEYNPDFTNPTAATYSMTNYTKTYTFNTVGKQPFKWAINPE